MAKVVRTYFDDYNEIVLSEEGYWFRRCKLFDGRYNQYIWTKWEKLPDLFSLTHNKVKYFDRSGVREIEDRNYVFDFGFGLNIYYIKYKGYNSREQSKYRVPSLNKYKLQGF